MEAEHLTLREFDSWRAEHDKKIDRLMALVEQHGDSSEHIALRVQALEINQEHAGRMSAKLSSGIALVISAIISGVFALIGGR